ncbi:rhodanese-like domain-containing protein [Kribbella ginsengisoli]|uniref:Rhodanese-like domain-containing protein n=2 Tax=Kribbella ginsengisoli TaxID=363865 RepID=A0ABP6Z7N5_9ACTN
MGNSVQDLVANARTTIQNLSVTEVAEALATGGVTLVDLREPAEVTRDGAIENAVFAPRGMLEFYADPASSYHRSEFDPEARVILYCASGGRSALAGRTLQELGYTDVSHLDGGLKAWIAAGRPISGASA